MTKREGSVGEGVRYIALASEIVILSLVGLFLGQILGQKLGQPFETIGVVLGALGGFIIGAYSVYKIAIRLDKQTLVHIGKKLCPECLRGIPAILEECPYCGYHRSREAEEVQVERTQLKAGEDKNRD
ncbi:MAG: hypothetical protein ACFFB3_08780 [Candidatus Hodarchaeota archaeon]